MPNFATLREKIAAEKDAREARHASYEAAMKLAWSAGRRAGEAVTPTTMVVVEPMGVSNLPRAIWRDDEGPWGFAWVTIRPATSGFAHWLRKHKLARKAYYGGIEIWVSEFGQSYERKHACAKAMAEVLRGALGTDRIYAGGRLD